MLKKLTLRQIEVFVLAAKLGSFGEAAESLGITQPALSQAVRDLEVDYGAQLFDRSTRPVTLTALGRQFLPIAERVVNAYHSAREDLENLAAGREGRVTIASLHSFASGFLPAVLAGFAKSRPGIVVEVMEGLADRVTHLVQTAVADFGIVNIAHVPPELEARPVLQDAYGVVCTNDHPLAAKTAVTWREMSAFPLVGMTKSTDVWHEMESAIHETNVQFRVNCWASNPATILSVIAAGLGVGPLPGLVRRTLCHPNLVDRPLVEPTVKRTLGVVTRRGDALSPAANLLISRLIEHARALGPDGSGTIG